MESRYNLDPLRRFILLGLLPVLVLAGTARAVVWRVPEAVQDLQQALDLAQDRDTVLVAPGVYTGHFRLLDKSLTLASWHLADGDSSRIVDTVLDGDGTGTVLFVRSAGQRHPVIHGFTLRNGLGDLPGGGDSDVAGGLHMDDNSNATLRWLNFEQNRGPALGAAIVHRGDWGRLRLEHLHFHDNRTLSGFATRPAAYLRTNQSVVLSHISATLAGNSDAILRVMAFDSLTVDHVRIRDQHLSYTWPDPYGSNARLLQFSGDQYARITDVLIEGCTTQSGGFLSAYSTSHLELSDVRLLGNANTGMQYERHHPFGLEAYGGDRSHIHDITLAGNTIPHNGTLVLLGSPGASELERVVLEHNTLGTADTLDVSEGWIPGVLAGLQATRIRDLRVEGNRRIIPALFYGGQGQGFTCNGGLVDIEASPTADTLRLTDLQICGNLLEDLDYPMVQESSHTGLGLRIETESGVPTLLEACRLNDNRVSRLPVTPGSYIQSALPSLVDLQGGAYHLRDVQMLRNTSGALNGIVTRILAENLYIVDPGRHGIHLEAGEIRLRNVLVQGVDQPANVLPRFSHALAALGGNTVELRNCTVAGNRATELLSLQTTAAEPAWLKNCCLVENTVVRLEDESLEDGQAWQPARFEHCLLPAWRPGVDNRISPTHAMVGERLLRGFRAGSPCIDGGDPSPGWNDREDPERPGQPAVPGSGTLRNDIGHLGGPLARVLPCVDPMPTTPPARLSVSGGRVHLDWEPVGESSDGCPLEAVEYEVQATRDLTGPWIVVTRTDATHWSQVLVAGLDRRCYRVTAHAADTVLPAPGDATRH